MGKTTFLTKQMINGIRYAYDNPKISPANGNDLIINMQCSVSNQTISVNLKGIPDARTAVTQLHGQSMSHASSLTKISMKNKITNKVSSIVCTNTEAVNKAKEKHITDAYQSYLTGNNNSGKIIIPN